jgi:hypothetical protein
VSANCKLCVAQELGCILTWVICTFYCSGFRWKCPVSTANFHTLVGDQLQIGPTGRANTKTSPLTRNQPSNLNITESGVQNHNPAWSTGLPEFIIIPPWTSGLTLDIIIGNHPPAIRVLLLRSQLFRLLHLKAGGWNSYGIWLLRSNGLRDHFRDLSDCSFNDEKCPIVWSSKKLGKMTNHLILGCFGDKSILPITRSGLAGPPRPAQEAVHILLRARTTQSNEADSRWKRAQELLGAQIQHGFFLRQQLKEGSKDFGQSCAPFSSDTSRKWQRSNKSLCFAPETMQVTDSQNL